MQQSAIVYASEPFGTPYLASLEATTFIAAENRRHKSQLLHPVRATGPDTFDVPEDFTIRGVTKPKKLTPLAVKNL
jgi:hypothetical protein